MKTLGHLALAVLAAIGAYLAAMIVVGGIARAAGAGTDIWIVAIFFLAVSVWVGVLTFKRMRRRGV